MKRILSELEKQLAQDRLQQRTPHSGAIYATVRDLVETLQPLYKPVSPSQIDFAEDDWGNAEPATPAELDALAGKHITHLSKLIELCKAALLGMQQGKPPATVLAGLGPEAVCQTMHVCLVAYRHLLAAPKLHSAAAEQKYIVESNAIALISGMLALGLTDAASGLCTRVRRTLACRGKTPECVRDFSITRREDEDSPGLAELVLKLLYLEVQCAFARHDGYESSAEHCKTEWGAWMRLYRESAPAKGDEYEKRLRGLVVRNVTKAFSSASLCSLEEAQRLMTLAAEVCSADTSAAPADFFALALRWEREAKQDGRALHRTVAAAARRTGLLPMNTRRRQRQGCHHHHQQEEEEEEEGFCENYVFWCAACMQSFARNNTAKQGLEDGASFAEGIHRECAAYIEAHKKQPPFYAALLGVCAADLRVAEGGGADALAGAEVSLSGAAREVLNDTDALKRLSKTQASHMKWALYALRKAVKSTWRPFVSGGLTVPKPLLAAFGVAMYGLAKVSLLVPRGGGNSSSSSTTTTTGSTDSNHRTLAPRFEWFEHATTAVKAFFAAGEYAEVRRVAKFIHRRTPGGEGGGAEEGQAARLAFILLRSQGVALHNEREYGAAAELLGRAVDVLRRQPPAAQAENSLDEAYLFAAASRQALGGEENLAGALSGYAASVLCNLRFRRPQLPRNAVERYMRVCATAFPRDVSKVALLLDTVGRAEDADAAGWVPLVGRLQLAVCRDMCLPLAFHQCVLSRIINATYATQRRTEYAEALVSMAVLNRTLHLARRKTFSEPDTPCTLLRRAIASALGEDDNSDDTDIDTDEDYNKKRSHKNDTASSNNESKGRLLCVLAEAHTWLGICTLETRLRASDAPRKSSIVTETSLAELLAGADEALRCLHHGVYLWQLLAERCCDKGSNDSNTSSYIPTPVQLQAVQYLADVLAVLGDFGAQIKAAACGVRLAQTLLLNYTTATNVTTAVHGTENAQMTRNNIITVLVNLRLGLARTYDLLGLHAAAERAITLAESDVSVLSEGSTTGEAGLPPQSPGQTSTTAAVFDRDSAFCSNIRLYILAGRLRHNTTIYGVHGHGHHDKGDVRRLFCEADLALRELSSRVDVCKTWGAYVIRSELEHAVAAALLLHGSPGDAQAAAAASLDHKLRVSAVVMPGVASSGSAASSTATPGAAEPTDQLLGEVRFRPYASDWRVLEGASESLAQLAAINVVQEALSTANVAMLRGAALGAVTAAPRMYWLHVQDVAELESRRGNAEACARYTALLDPALRETPGRRALAQSPEYAVYERRLGDFARRAGQSKEVALTWYEKAKTTLEKVSASVPSEKTPPEDTRKGIVACWGKLGCLDTECDDALEAVSQDTPKAPLAKKPCLKKRKKKNNNNSTTTDENNSIEARAEESDDRGSFPINFVDNIRAEIVCCEAELRQAEQEKKEKRSRTDGSLGKGNSVDDITTIFTEGADSNSAATDKETDSEDEAVKTIVKSALKEHARPDIRARLKLVHATLLAKRGSRKAACESAKDAYEKALLSQREPSLLHKTTALYANAKCVALKDTLFTDDDSELTDIAFLLHASQGVSLCQQMARQEEGEEEMEEEEEDSEEGEAAGSDNENEGAESPHRLRARFLAKTPGRHVASTVEKAVRGRRRKSFRRNADKGGGTRRVSLFDMFAGANRRDFAQRYVDCLPHEWTVVSIARQGSVLLLARVHPGCRPVVQTIPEAGTAATTLVSELRDFVTKNRDTAIAAAETDAEKLSWTAVRGSLNSEMRRFIARIEDTALGPTKALLVGPYAEPLLEAALCAQVDELLQKNAWLPVQNKCVRDLLLLVMAAMPYLTPQEVKWWAAAFVDAAFCPGREAANAAALAHDLRDFHAAALANAFRVVREAGRLGAAYASVPDQKEAHTSWTKSLPRRPVILVLDRDVQELPWESIPCLATYPVTRIPSIAFAAALGSSLTQQQQSQQEIEDIFTPKTPGQPQPLKRSHESTDDSVITKHRANRGIVRDGVSMDKVLYILDPKQNLPVLVDEMRPVVEANPKWTGTISVPPPPPQELRDQAARADLFMYCGHGSGETYLPSNEITSLPDATAPAAMLMGCSSAKLFDNGDFEPTGAPTHWLCAGSPAVIGFLWEATDKNADTLTQALLSFWAGLAPQHHNHSTFENDNSVPKATEASQTTSLSEALARARQRCSFEHLIGAAAVYYGVPVYCKKLSSSVAATLSAATSSAFRKKSRSRIPHKERGPKNPYLTPYSSRSSRILCCNNKIDVNNTEKAPPNKQTKM